MGLGAERGQTGQPQRWLVVGLGRRGEDRALTAIIFQRKQKKIRNI
jgi:hypothetical protein